MTERTSASSHGGDGMAEKLILSDVATTGVLTAICHTIESRSRAPLLKDPQAETSAARLAPLLANSRNTLLRRLARGRVRGDLVIYFAIRARKNDQYARDFVQRRPGGCVVNSVWLRPALKWTIDFRLKQQLGVGQGAGYQSGIRDGHEVEQWSPGLRFPEEWSYVDDQEPRLGLYRHWKLLCYTQWAVGYLLGPKDAPDVI